MKHRTSNWFLCVLSGGPERMGESDGPCGRTGDGPDSSQTNKSWAQSERGTERPIFSLDRSPDHKRFPFFFQGPLYFPLHF
jgi:hypothetical protein